MKNLTMHIIRKYVMVTALALASLVLTVPAASGAPNPGKREDAAAQREREMRTADTLEVVQANQELTRTELTEMKGEMEKLKTEIASAKAENAALKAALEKSEQSRQKEREVLLDEVSKMIAANAKKAGKGSSGSATNTSVKPANTQKSTSTQQGDGASSSSSSSRDREKDKEKDKDKDVPSTVTSRPRTTENGFSHVVQKGQSLTLIAQAFREQGVNVSVDDIVKANDLPSRDIKPGQKLFIPKK
ncbi:MAG TPA: LysM peptidoglycan-binding domain-containing protein [Candidatus Methylacidiphilales bacterium]|nr:LysM peptidoglycan-binding domain-containing protein [Candidatus Methylacidiphilales bacterium]